MKSYATYHPQSLGLVAQHYRNIKSGAEYERFFTGAGEGTNPILERDADVFSTLEHMEAIVAKYKHQAAPIARHLQAGNRKATCKNIFDWCYNHIQYKLDKAGEEQLRTPLRSWKDRKTGIDCDCYSILVASILSNLNIPFAFRIIKLNGKADYQHVYVVVPSVGTDITKSRSSYIVIDPVLDKFDKEAPGITQIHDKGMAGIPVRLLNGLADATPVNPIAFDTPLSTAQFTTEAAALTQEVIQNDVVTPVSFSTDKEIRKQQFLDRAFKLLKSYRRTLIMKGFHLRKDYNLVQFLDLLLNNWTDPKRRYAAWLLFIDVANKIKAADNDKSDSPFDKLGDAFGDLAQVPGKVVSWAGDKIEDAWMLLKQGALFGPRQLMRAAIAVNVFNVARKIDAGLLTWPEAKKRGYSVAQWQRNVKNTQSTEAKWRSIGGNVGDLRSAVGQGAAPSGIKLGEVATAVAGTAGAGLVATYFIPLLQTTQVVADTVNTTKQAADTLTTLTDNGTQQTDTGAQQYPSTRTPAPYEQPAKKNESNQSNTGLYIGAGLTLLAIVLIATKNND